MESVLVESVFMESVFMESVFVESGNVRRMGMGRWGSFFHGRKISQKLFILRRQMKPAPNSLV